MIPLTRIYESQRAATQYQSVREIVRVRADKIVYVKPGDTSGSTVYIETAAGWIIQVAETEDQILALLEEEA